MNPENYEVLTLNDQCPSHVETSQLICSANQMTGSYMRGTLAVKGLTKNLDNYYLWQFPARIIPSLDSLICVGKFHENPFLALTGGLSCHPK